MDDSMMIEQLRAVADPIRLSIVRELRGGTRCACELADVAEVSSTLLSHHLKVLRKAGLISGARRGRWIDYTLDEARFRALLGWLDTPAPRRAPRLDCAS